MTHPPDNLPVPQDDGACDHLSSNPDVPSTPLASTRGSKVSLSATPGLTIIFCYPRTAAPDEQIPEDWDAIPGARGCTPQACSFRDRLPDLKRLGVSSVYGLSTQTPEEQREAAARLHLEYELLSDERLEFVDTLGLPTFEWRGRRLSKRVTLAVEDGRVSKYWYPVFPSWRNVDNVLEWLEGRG